MKITGTMSYLEIEIDDKVIKVSGEMITGGFVAYKNSMKRWNSPHENELIDEEKKKKIIKEVEDYTKDSHMIITFE